MKISKSNTGKKRAKEISEKLSKLRIGRKDSLDTKNRKSNSAKVAWERRKINVEKS
jgi:hypothetical protein